MYVVCAWMIFQNSHLGRVGHRDLGSPNLMNTLVADVGQGQTLRSGSAFLMQPGTRISAAKILAVRDPIGAEDSIASRAG